MNDERRCTPCPEHERACLEAAWGLGDDPRWAAHRSECPRCRLALEATSGFAGRVRSARIVVPEGVGDGLAGEVFARTTRRAGGRPAAAWGWAAGAAVAAGAALLVLRRPASEMPGEALELAAVDPDLLENLELAENLEVLELLDALEALDDV